MKAVRGLRGPAGPARLDPSRDSPDVGATEAVRPSAEAAVAPIARLRRRDELFDDIDEPSEEATEEPVLLGRLSTITAVQNVALAERSLQSFRSADIAALIDRLGAIAAPRAAQTLPALDVLRRLKRLMEYTERRRTAARPLAGPPAASDGLKRQPSPQRPDFAPRRDAPARPASGDRDGAVPPTRVDKDRLQ
jgi:hypothetical protein